MSMWAQVLDDRTDVLAPDGATLVDVYAQFSFGGVPLPEGTQVNFVVGTGSADGTISTLEELLAAVVPIDGIELFSAIGIVENQIVRDPNGDVTVRPVARATMKPVSNTFYGSVTIAAYSTYDKLGTAKRFSLQQIVLTAATGAGSFSGTLERYDPSLDEWTAKRAMKVGRSGVFSGYVSGKLYSIGGFAREFVDNVEEYDPVADEWADKSPLPTPRAFGCSAVYNDEIYTIGGYNFDPNRARQEVEKYTPATDEWATLSPLPVPLAFTTCAVVGGDIYVFYGSSKIDDNEKPTLFNSGVFKYHVADDTWSCVKSTYASPPTTTTTSAAPIGSSFIKVSSISLPQTGFVTVTDISTVQVETLAYKAYSNSTILLVGSTSIPLGAGSSVVLSSTNRSKLSPNSHVNGSTVRIFDGFDGTSYLSAIETYDTTTGASSVSIATTGIARSKAAQATVGAYQYVIGGSAAKSDYLADMERVDPSVGTFSGGLSKPDVFRTGATAVSDGTYVYLIGGQESGHDVGWVNLSCQATPESVLADGRTSVGISVSATDAGGDPPPTLTIKIKGLIYVAAAAVAGAVPPTSRNAPPTISILPVLFSAQQFDMVDGFGATTLLPRSEDRINEVDRLAEFVKGNEVLLSQQQLKTNATQLEDADQLFGQRRTLYKVAIEATIEDDVYFGTSNSTIVVGDGAAGQQGSFLNPANAQEGLSASVEFYSDIVSIPNVEVLTDGPLGGSDAKDVLDSVRKDVPFGASPHYDALVTAADGYIGTSEETSLIVSTCDNENSGSASSSDDVVSAANSVYGTDKLPVFVNTFVITDPVSLSARKARTDVSELEDISDQTGGNSFSIIDPSYVDFVIGRIKTSAPSSIGSGTVSLEHDVEGSLYSVSYAVSNLVVGNSASIVVSYSVDGYSFTQLDIEVPPNSEFVLEAPIQATKFRYAVTLRSDSFDTPVLTGVTVKYVKPSIQYLFTYPKIVSGQVTEMAAVTNQRLPAGCKVTIGLSHGDSIMFDRDFVTDGQPGVEGRGNIVAINRETAAVVDAVPYGEAMRTSNFISYSAASGPWASDAITQVFVNGEVFPDNDLYSVPESGIVVFKKKLASSDEVTLYVQNPSSFKVGLKIENPTLQQGRLDSFAFMWGTTSGLGATAPIIPPTVGNLFVSPSPAFPGGPLVANYTFRDLNGAVEDKEKTLITWFRDGVPVPELNNKVSVSDTDIIAKRVDASAATRISRGQQWSFSVRPSNGFVYGAAVVSSPVAIANNPPVASNLRYRSSNADPQVFTSSDGVFVDHDYFDRDGDTTGGDTIIWFVNGTVFKTGTINSIAPNEVDSNGLKAIRAGNVIFAEITPFDGLDYGNLIQGDQVTILATPPTASDVSILPTNPTIASTLRLTYKFFDPDGNPDQSQIAWFADGQRVTALDGSQTAGPTYPGGVLKQRQKWSAVVTPSDGQVQGVPASSNTVVIQF